MIVFYFCHVNLSWSEGVDFSSLLNLVQYLNVNNIGNKKKTMFLFNFNRFSNVCDPREKKIQIK